MYFINIRGLGGNEPKKRGECVSKGKDNGRPILEEERQTGFTVAMTPTLIEAVKTYAHEQHISPSSFVRDALKDKLRKAGRWTDDKGNDA